MVEKYRSCVQLLSASPFSVTSEEYHLKSSHKVHSLPYQVMNHVLIHIINLIGGTDVVFHITQIKLGLVEKNIPIILLVLRVC